MVGNKKAQELEQAERQMLRAAQIPLEFRMVRIPRNFLQVKRLGGDTDNAQKNKYWEISTVSTVNNSGATKPVCVLLHGWGGGKGIFVQSFDDLSRDFQVHAIDLLGWGRSSRPRYCAGSDPKKAQGFWVESLEAWRVSMEIERFTLVGHSMGGFVAASYALKYKRNLDRLILISPIGLRGFDRQPTNFSPTQQLLISSVWSLTPQRIVNLLPRKRILSILSDRRPDLIQAFPYEDSTAIDYFYNLAVQTPISGEAVFKRLLSPLKGWHLPLKEELHGLNDLSVQLVYGEHDWIDPTFAVFEMKEKILKNAKVYILPKSGHHNYAQRSMELNEIILRGDKPQCLVKEFDPERDGVLETRTISIA